MNEVIRNDCEAAEVATSGKVPGAVAIPRGLVEFRADPASAMHDKAFDRAKTVVAYCASGGRSALVGKTLKVMGYPNVRNLGGFKGWLEAGGDGGKARPAQYIIPSARERPDQ